MTTFAPFADGLNSSFLTTKSNLVEQASGHDRARLCCLNEFSLAWLNVCPTAANGLRLQPSEFCILNKLYLGEPTLPLNTALSSAWTPTGTTCCAAEKVASSNDIKPLFSSCGISATRPVSTLRARCQHNPYPFCALDIRPFWS